MPRKSLHAWSLSPMVTMQLCLSPLSQAALLVASLDAVIDITPTFDRDFGLRMASLVSASYCSDSAAIMSWQCERSQKVPSFVPHSTFEDGTALFAFSGFLPSPEGQIVIAFKGSDSRSLDDWVSNLKAYSKLNGTDWGSDVKVHSGFYELFQRLRPNITASIRDLLLQHPGASLVTTGHSLGGALASLCAVDAAHLFTNVLVRSITFGSPRVGNSAFFNLARNKLNQSWRVTHQRDIVPSLPPLLFGFHHLAREVWTMDLKAGRAEAAQTMVERRRMRGESASPSPSHELDYYVCDDSGEDPLCHNSVFSSSFADHLTYLNVFMPRILRECR